MPENRHPALPEAKNHSRLGIASFIISIIAALVICSDIILAFFSFDASRSHPVVVTALSCAAALALVGLGLGILAVARKNAKKLFGILGLVLNILIVIGICAFMGKDLLSVPGGL